MGRVESAQPTGVGLPPRAPPDLAARGHPPHQGEGDGALESGCAKTSSGEGLRARAIGSADFPFAKHGNTRFGVSSSPLEGRAGRREIDRSRGGVGCVL